MEIEDKMDIEQLDDFTYDYECIDEFINREQDKDRKYIFMCLANEIERLNSILNKITNN